MQHTRIAGPPVDVSDSSPPFRGLAPEMLIRSISQGRCILFAGAGLSLQSVLPDGDTLPTWAELLERMLDWCIENRTPLKAEPAEFRLLIEKGRLLVVAQELQQSLGGLVNACIGAALRTDTARPSEAHTLLAKIPWASVFTSNYDTLIESAYCITSNGLLPPVVLADGVAQAVGHLRNKRPFVFKVHGCVNTPGSIVLGNRDYSRMLYLNPAYRSFLESVFSSYTVLFVGFSGSDPDLDAVIDRLSTVYEQSISQHFILLPEGKVSGIERRRLLEDKRLDCITYTPDERHSSVPGFFKELLSRCDSNQISAGTPKCGKVFICGSSSDNSLRKLIAKELQRNGIDTWIDVDQISLGDVLSETLARAIDECTALVVLWTEHASRSEWVRHEMSLAFGARKPILAVAFGDASRTWPSFLSGYIYTLVDSKDEFESRAPEIAIDWAVKIKKCH